MLHPPVLKARLYQVWSGQPLTEAESTFKPALLVNWEGTANFKQSSYQLHHFSRGEALHQIALTHTYERASGGSISREFLQSSKVISTRDTFLHLPVCLFWFPPGLFTCIRFTRGLVFNVGLSILVQVVLFLNSLSVDTPWVLPACEGKTILLHIAF